MTTIFHLFLCWFGVLYAGINGLWLLCGSLPSSAIPSHHVPQVCAPLMSGPRVLGFARVMVHTGGVLGRPSVVLTSVSRSPLVQLCCISSHANRLVLFGVVGGVITASSISISIFHALILSQILHVPSAKVRCRAFSACGCTYSLFVCSGGQGIHLFSNFFSRNCGPGWMCLSLLHQSGSHA